MATSKDSHTKDDDDSLALAYEAYADRHAIRAAPILTVTDIETAAMIADRLALRIEGKTIVEIGGGTGLLSIAMGYFARRVYCIEANPAWSLVFVRTLLEKKPKNVSFLFGMAEEFVGCIKADVAVICTNSDVRGMKLIGKQFAPEVIDFYGEMIDENPAAYDAFARRAREFV